MIGGKGKRKKTTWKDANILASGIRLYLGHFSYIKLSILARMHCSRHWARLSWHFYGNIWHFLFPVFTHFLMLSSVHSISTLLTSQQFLERARHPSARSYSTVLLNFCSNVTWSVTSSLRTLVISGVPTLSLSFLSCRVFFFVVFTIL